MLRQNYGLAGICQAVKLGKKLLDRLKMILQSFMVPVGCGRSSFQQDQFSYVKQPSNNYVMHSCYELDPAPLQGMSSSGWRDATHFNAPQPVPASPELSSRELSSPLTPSGQKTEERRRQTTKQRKSTKKTHHIGSNSGFETDCVSNQKVQVSIHYLLHSCWKENNDRLAMVRQPGYFLKNWIGVKTSMKPYRIWY